MGLPNGWWIVACSAGHALRPVSPADRLLRPKVRAWQPSGCGSDLIDLELDGYLAPVPGYARPVW
ncbi:hypothetical protein ACFYRG_50115 [Streptomyces mirabilis]